MKYSLLLLSLVFLSGCRYIPFWPDSAKGYEEAKATQEELSVQGEEKSRQLTTAVVEVLEDEPKEIVTPRSRLALSFAQQDQMIEGLPIEPISVESFIDLAISENDKDIKELQKKLARLEESVAEFRQTKLINKLEVNARTEELVNKGILYEEEHKKKTWEKVWSWAKGTLGIGGIIALVLLCPAIIPIFGQMLGAVVKAIPSLASAFGVAATSTVDALVKGVQQTRKQIKNGGDGPYTKDEVLSIIDGNLAFHQKEADEKLVTARKTALSI